MSPVLPELDRSASRPLSEQIAAHFRGAIQRARYRPGDRLPTIRAVAEELGVTRATVQDAYRQLGAEGLITATVGRGTLVAAPPGAPEPLSPLASAALVQVREAPAAPRLPAGRELVANFADLPPDAEGFPVAELRRALDAALARRGGSLLGYGHPAGLPELRAHLAARPESGEPSTDPEGVVVTSGAQQAIDLALRTFTSPGDAVAVPVPTYQQLFGLLEANGLRLVPVPADSHGLDLDALGGLLARERVRLLCLMPTFHNPTGRTLDLAARRALMEVVAATGVPVLADEYEWPLRFAGETLPSLQTFDPRGLTVTVRSFSKGLFPGLRIGWVHAGPRVVAPMVAVKRFMDLETSPLLQAGLLEFLESGAFDRYLGDLRRDLALRHRAAREALVRHLPGGFTWSEPEGGFALWAEGPAPGIGDRIAARAAAGGVLVTPGSVFDPLGRPSAGFRLSLSRSDPARIEAGIAVLGRCARESADPGAEEHPPLFL